ncbi:hypothetical protein [Paractinoplanes maris]|nr:hypothetical protein [Actinoplanes maris]
MQDAASAGTGTVTGWTLSL